MGVMFKNCIRRYKMILLLGLVACFSCYTEYMFETEKNTPSPASAPAHVEHFLHGSP